VPLDDVDTALTAGLRDITRGTIGKGRARMRLAREIAFNSSDFDVESFLSLLLGCRADAQTDPNPEISLIDESSAVREDSDAWCASCGHELLLCGRRSIFEGGCKTRQVGRSGQLRQTTGLRLRSLTCTSCRQT
jgi:hypothetical protein